jgi:lipoprotein-releasing system ATP-binding protein
MSNVIECRGLEKTFHDGSRELRVLRGVDLAVAEQEIVAISGASGAGKTTLLQIMGTLDRPTGGELLFRGESLSSMGRAAVNRVRNQEIGFVFQFYHLLAEFTALENVMMPALCQGVSKLVCAARGHELLEAVGLADRITHKPGQLSGGEQQRVAIARALFNEPSIVLSDEPTGNLDEYTGRGIVELLFEICRSRAMTLVIVTHDLDLAAWAHRWIHLHDGMVQVK